MSALLRRLATLPCALLAVAALAGCAVVETVPISPKPLAYNEPSCRSQFGAYYLPRRLLSLHATAAADNITLTGLDLPPLMASDRRQPFCLDHLALPTSRDIITVERDPATGLLLSVSSSVEDRTPAIAKTLIAAGENFAIAGLRSGALNTVGDKDELHIDFDPFVWDELMIAKKALKRFGFCVYIEGETFEPPRLEAKSMFEAAKRWCSHDHPPGHRWQKRFAQLPVPEEAIVAGILYRPNIPYKIVVLRQKDPGRSPWAIYQTKRVEMPNVSPVMVVGVERAMFAKRETTLKFDNGVLTDVAIKKGSELEGFVEIPLAAAHAIVDVPAQLVQIRIADTSNQTELLKAQLDLMDTMSKLPEGFQLDRSARLRDARFGTRGSADARAGRFLAACTDQNQDPDACQALLRGARR